ncbi:hypothetical protein [Prosthecobacter sp.]|uniref:GAP1-N2 domain-containing protein n=1 Tax=Prosthecobacter sp. TaxID=1965333 RepID=UPI003783804D
MAWQLIYTSAPRLLEAGRTGFGTVARHRAVSGMLASAVERFSQFARLPGHDPRRVVYTCRVLTVGSGTYHVLSCLQDAGSDYTGRTNHIAHHLIAEPREVRALAASGLTPADVLLGMAWRSSWSEGPRFLDASEEVDLSSFAPSASHAWASVTGNPASAGILWSREAVKGCYLIVPPEVSVLELFRESAHAEPAQAWQTRFTTCLEPNDDVADFRWVALSSTSPLRTQVETSNRLTLDLTRPDTLPPPPEREAPPAAPEIQNPAAATARQPEQPAPVSAPSWEQAAASAAVPASSNMTGWSPEPRRKGAKSAGSFIGLSLIIACVLVLAVVGMLMRESKQQERQDFARATYESAIAKVWKDHDLELEDTRHFLESQPDLEAGRELLKSHEQFFRAMQRLLQKPAEQVPLVLPSDNKDDLRNLSKLLEQWAALHANPWQELRAAQGRITAEDIEKAYGRWEAARKAKWQQLGRSVSLKSVPPPPEGRLIEVLKSEAKAALRGAEPARDARELWTSVFEQLARQAAPVDPEVQRWLELWKDLDANNYAAAQKAAADTSLPSWLQKKAVAVQQKHDKDRDSQMSTDREKDKHPPKEPEKQTIVIEDADSPTAKNGIYLHLLQPGEDPTGKITVPKVSADMEIYVGGAWDAHPPPDAKTGPKDGDLKKWRVIPLDNPDETKFAPTINASETISFSKDGTLLAIPAQYHESPAGLRIVARSKDLTQVLFDLRLIPVSSVTSKPVFTQTITATVSDMDVVTLSLPAGFLNRLHLQKPAYALRKEGSATEQKFYAMKSSGDSAFEVLPPQASMKPTLNRAEIEKRIKELEANIQNYTTLLEKTKEPGISKSQREADEKRYNDIIATKEIELLNFKTQLQNLEAAPVMHFDLLPGSYTLLVELANNKIELCRLNVVPATSYPQSKPSNP